MNTATAWALKAGIVVIAYTYLVYPLIVATLAAVKPRRPGPFADIGRLGFSIVMTVYNEAGRIERRVRELHRLISASGHEGELVVVSDGSTDGSGALARDLRLPGVRVVELGQNQGKAAALSAGCAQCSSDLLVFADVRQEWDVEALKQLLASFKDPRVGGASGDLVIRGADGPVAGVGLYWKFEKWLRIQEGRFRSTVGVSGSISAVRRHLFLPMPRGLILDDLWWPMHVVMKGFAVVHNSAAIAYDVPADPRGEFKRKVRTLSGNFQLVQQLPRLLLPWRNPIWFEFVSHKLLRLAVPWALLVVLFASLATHDSPYMVALLSLQLLFYCVGTLSLLSASASRLPFASAAGSFILLNSAAWWAFWVWVFGRSANSWQSTKYK
jgi:biofilm PGA synthesis N-glycosyltransferase PgaC